jgi:hypothetical protein
MKKTKQKGPKKPQNRPNPISQPTQQPRQQQRIALLDSLDNLQDSKIRLEACAAIAAKFEPGTEDENETLKQQEEIRVKLRKEIMKLSRDGMFKSLVRLVLDTDYLVRLNAIGALRNLGLTGGDKALAIMQQEDAWTALLQTIGNTIGNIKESDEIKVLIIKESLRLMDLLCEWSPAVAEKRFSESLGVLIDCLRHTNRDVVEACAKLIWTASADNSALANSLASSEAGKQVCSMLEGLVNTQLSTVPNANIVAAAYSFGALLNVALTYQHSELPKLVLTWFAACGNLLSEASLPNVTIDQKTIEEAMAFEAEDMAEDGQNKSESDAMRQWLDVVQAQSLVFDCFGDLLRKTVKSKEEKKNIEFWADVAMPLENGGLLPSSFMFGCSIWPGENNGPKTLTLPVAALQQSAAECASACIDAYSIVDANILREAWTRTWQVLYSTCFQGLQHPEVNGRLTAYAQLLSSIARRSRIPLAISFPELSKVLKECHVQDVRALLSGVLGIIAQLDSSQIQTVASVFLEATPAEKNLIVACEHVDVIIDMFSEDDRQPLFDSMNGLQLFTDFAKTFESRFAELKREENILLDDDICERMFEVKANVDAFIKWRKGG